MKNNILEYQVYAKTTKSLVRDILRDLDSKNKITVNTINPHSYVVALSDSNFQCSLKNSSYLIPDGVGITLASKILGNPIKETIPGPDYFDLFCRQEVLNKKKYKHFFLGSSAYVLNRMAVNLTEKYNINICGYYSPPYKDVFNKSDTNKMIGQINNSNCDVLWIGMTAPKQEKWLMDNIRNIDFLLASSIGATFDFVAETVPRAPSVIRNIGLEGVYRLFKEPKRIAPRAFISDPYFVYCVFKDLFYKILAKIKW
jgi:N-acetylglucosaminyldiphosphoundecaprenol N-acetyl-beta-D-mannosaminyltransferase